MNAPQDLVFARGSLDNRTRFRDILRAANRRKFCVAVRIQIEVQPLGVSDSIFGSRGRAGD